MQRDGAGDFAIAGQQIDDAEIAGLADIAGLIDYAAQGLGNRGPGVQKVDIDAARPIVSGRYRLSYTTAFARPADAPLLHFRNAGWALLAQQLRERVRAEATSGRQRIIVMMRPVIGRFR